MISELNEKVNVQIRGFLNEKERRLFLAEIAMQCGYGAGMALSKRTGHDTTGYEGIVERRNDGRRAYPQKRSGTQDGGGNLSRHHRIDKRNFG